MHPFRVLITGSNGLLGQALLNRFSLERRDYQLLATSKGSPRGLSKNLSYETLDITHLSDVERLCKAFKPQCVLHTAALTNVDTCENRAAQGIPNQR